ncbi:ankyrin [Conidiobolus coronatus NRRL 28638]|uniref:Ankyrin n=1 Tax=Conidiobolus coronatus (strain ATCC 28846 / CBS 209.66 / NRRL 28638) TaxID=796925 RepID=A0A137PHD4_CONC2|nr:ankyrin [Conidiobolus coronatus NRRL 28638]|eukprot:KXN74392.1 ankyrin [Conidiobolus coronatus NRRL 28638]
MSSAASSTKFSKADQLFRTDSKGLSATNSLRLIRTSSNPQHMDNKVNPSKNLIDLNCLILRAISKNLTDTVKFLISEGADVNFASPWSDKERGPFEYITPLGRACQLGSTTMVKLLIDMGANVNQFHSLALLIAIQYDQPRIIEYLLERQVELNFTIHQERNPLQLVFNTKNVRIFKILLPFSLVQVSLELIFLNCCRLGLLHFCEFMLSQVDSRDHLMDKNNVNPLLINIKNQNWPLVRFLLDNIYDIQALENLNDFPSMMDLEKARGIDTNTNDSDGEEEKPLKCHLNLYNLLATGDEFQQNACPPCYPRIPSVIDCNQNAKKSFLAQI